MGFCFAPSASSIPTQNLHKESAAKLGGSAEIRREGKESFGNCWNSLTACAEQSSNIQQESVKYLLPALQARRVCSPQPTYSSEVGGVAERLAAKTTEKGILAQILQTTTL